MLSHLRLVLVRPIYETNVGAVARIAANFDLRDVVVVAPACNISGQQAKLYGKGPARKYLESMKVLPDLKAALSDCTSVIGFTRRTSQNRRAVTTINDLTRLPNDKTALLFGPEDAGLSNEDLLWCSSVCSLHVADVMPSLNLSHAVAIVVARLYESALDSSTKPKHKQLNLAAVEDLDNAFAHWRQTMIDAGMKSGFNPDRPLSVLRKLVQRAHPTQQEVQVLRVFLSKVQAALGTRSRTK